MGNETTEYTVYAPNSSCKCNENLITARFHLGIPPRSPVRLLSGDLVRLLSGDPDHYYPAIRNITIRRSGTLLSGDPEHYYLFFTRKGALLNPKGRHQNHI